MTEYKLLFSSNNKNFFMKYLNNKRFKNKNLETKLGEKTINAANIIKHDLNQAAIVDPYNIYTCSKIFLEKDYTDLYIEKEFGALKEISEKNKKSLCDIFNQKYDFEKEKENFQENSDMFQKINIYKTQFKKLEEHSKLFSLTFKNNLSQIIKTKKELIENYEKIIEKEYDEKLTKFTRLALDQTNAKFELVESFITQNKKKYSPNEILSEIEKDFKNETSVTINLKTDLKNLYKSTINVDKGQIKDILSNYISNAKKYATQNINKIDIVYYQNKKNIKIGIRDYGEHKIENPEKIFNKLFQEKNGIDRSKEKKENETEGLSKGMGLYNTKCLAEWNNCSVYTTNNNYLGKKEKGNTFWIEIPSKKKLTYSINKQIL